MGQIFEQAQHNLANHKKNCVALHKLHLQAEKITKLFKKDDGVRLVGEKAFGDVFIHLVNRVLVVKKGPAAADRIVRFVGSYMRFMNEKAATSNPPADGPSTSMSAPVSEEDEDTMASRFISRLLAWFLQGFTAKNKITRYRSVCLVSELISHLGEIE